MNLESNNEKAECCRSSREHSGGINITILCHYRIVGITSVLRTWNETKVVVMSGFSDERGCNSRPRFYSVFLEAVFSLLTLTINVIIPSLFSFSFTLHLLYKCTLYPFISFSFSPLMQREFSLKSNALKRKKAFTSQVRLSELLLAALCIFFWPPDSSETVVVFTLFSLFITTLSFYVTSLHKGQIWNFGHSNKTTYWIM